MRSWRRPRVGRPVDEAGRVACPIRGIDLSLEECLICEHLEAIERSDQHALVLCRPARKSLVEAPPQP